MTRRLALAALTIFVTGWVTLFVTACPKPPAQDCRTQGCPPGYTCQSIEAGYRCVKDSPIPPAKCPDQCPPGQVCTDPHVGCVPTGPVVQHPELKLEAKDGTIYRNGAKHDMRLAVFCWDDLELDHAGWTTVEEKWADYAASKGANTLMARLGMYDRDDRWANGQNFGGGPCLNDADDCAQGFNPEWWQKAHDRGKYAADKYGMNLLVSIQDGWNCKHCLWGDVPCALSEAELKACGNTLTDFHKRWVRQVVETWCQDAYVFYEDGNEISTTAKAAPSGGPLKIKPRAKRRQLKPYTYSPAWSVDMRNYVREVEAQLGCVPGRPFGTNSGKDEVEANPVIDFTITHGVEMPAVLYGKWRLQNEHNPPLTPEQERSYYCAWKEKGLTWGYWRGGQTQADMERTLDYMFSIPCDQPVPSTCPAPVPNPANLKWKIKVQGSWYDATPVSDKNCEYCMETGQGDNWTRCECPARMEGDPNRLPCEQVLIESPFPVWRGDGTIETQSNGFLARCGDCSYLEVCNGPLTKCARAF